MNDLPRRLAAEAVGTAFLLATVVGSGIMALKLAGGNGALALLCNTIPTGAILAVLILTFGPLSGAHFNPAVSLAFAWRGELPARLAGLYIAAQVIGGIVGVWAAALATLDNRPHGAGAVVRRSRRARVDHLRMPCPHACRDPLCRWAVHHSGLLVHGFNVLRQSGRNCSAGALRHVCGDRARWRPRVHRRSTGWHGRRRHAREVASEGQPAGQLKGSRTP